MRTVAIVGMLALLVAAPAALAQDASETTNDTKPHVDCPPGETCTDKAAGGARPDDAAWVEDCPPDAVCAAGAEEPSRGPSDGSCENCRGNDTHEYGPEGCIECTGGPVGETCMDGQQGNETCRDDVQYFGGEPYSTGVQDQSSGADAKTVPAIGALGILAAFVLAVVLVARRD